MLGMGAVALMWTWWWDYVSDALHAGAYYAAKLADMRRRL